MIRLPSLKTYITPLLTIVCRRMSSIPNATTTIAVCQMSSGNDKSKNLETMLDLIAKAAVYKSKMVFFPECFDYIGTNVEETLSLVDSEGGTASLLAKLGAAAKEHGCWLSLGGYHERPQNAFFSADTAETRLNNVHSIIDSDGNLVTSYHKTHLFGVEIPGRVSLQESRFSIPGTQIIPPVDCPVGSLGLATCYDLRFSEMSTLLRQMGANVLSFPSAFTLTTGQAHWEVLLRARAIENQSWVVAAAQAGVHNPSFGHAMVVDPWGTVVAQVSGDSAGLCIAEIDHNRTESVRMNMPCAEHRRTDLYSLTRILDHSLPIPCDRSFVFGPKEIPSNQLFYLTELSYAFVNIKPVIPGHVLVAPQRCVLRLSDLSHAEITDLFDTIKRLQKPLENYYKAESSTIAVQDGPDAGQSIPHVHVHLLPRKPRDFPNGDEVYTRLENHDTDLEGGDGLRSHELMKDEAAQLRKLFTYN